MIHHELADIAGINANTLKIHIRNKTVPFKTELTQGKDGAGRTWSRYDAHDAAYLIAARQLVANGVGWAEACRMLREPSIATAGGIGPGNSYMERSGVFIAQVEFVSQRTNDKPEQMERLRVYKGPIGEIITSAHQVAANYSARRPDDPVTISGIVAVDLSHAYQLAQTIADRLSIDLSPDARPDSPSVLDEFEE